MAADIIDEQIINGGSRRKLKVQCMTSYSLPATLTFPRVKLLSICKTSYIKKRPLYPMAV